MTTTASDLQVRRDAALRFKADRALAHRVLFKDRHTHASPACHDEMIAAWHSPAKFIQTWAFRGLGKSTIGEEGMTLGALFQDFHNGLIVGSSEARAMDRLESIAHELESNEYLHQVFGKVKGNKWADRSIQLSNGVFLQAVGRGQKMRGIKKLNWRPDFIWLDDVDEDEDSRASEVFTKTANWYYHTLYPAADPGGRFRCTATPREPEALPGRLARDRAWTLLTYPIEFIGFDGERAAQWPERFPLDEIDHIIKSYEDQGKLELYRQEYMCEMPEKRRKSFSGAMFPVVSQTRTWEATYAMVDPARTTDIDTSATTGYVVWSWRGSRLVVWEALGRFDKPAEIIDRMFKIDDEFSPVFIGFEKTGLNEWAMQPIRAEMIRRGRALPLYPLEAPNNKIHFIEGLEPFATGGDIILAKEMPDLVAQFDNLPRGRIDIPNALAYAIKLRPGQPIYEDFQADMVTERVVVDPARPWWLAVNAERGVTTGVLVQFRDGRTVIVADWVMEGDPGHVLPRMAQEARLEARRTVRMCVHPQHFRLAANTGLVQAARRETEDVYKGGELPRGRTELQNLMKRLIRGESALQVALHARWTANGLAGGYCRRIMKTGVIEDDTEKTPYQTMIEGLESMIALSVVGQPQDGEETGHFSVTNDGRRYRSALKR